jgi:hypothetical protein
VNDDFQSTNLYSLSFTQYELPLLKEYCEKVLVQCCTVENAMELIKLAKLYSLEEASREIKNYISK